MSYWNTKQFKVIFVIIHKKEKKKYVEIGTKIKSPKAKKNKKTNLNMLDISKK